MVIAIALCFEAVAAFVRENDSSVHPGVNYIDLLTCIALHCSGSLGLVSSERAYTKIVITILRVKS